jgi:RecB family exonuclease
MTIAVDVDLLRQHRLALLAEADEIERRACLDPPDAGALTALTAEALDHFTSFAGRLAEHLRELADALDRWLTVARASDGEVGLGLDLLTSGVLAL